MKLALDPYMIQAVPLNDLPGVVADLGHEWIELSPRDDFIPFSNHPQVAESSITMHDTIRSYLDKWSTAPKLESPSTATKDVS